MTADIFPFISRITCSAQVGLGSPEILAEGAAIGQPEILITSCSQTVQKLLLRE